jgi:hypothetical protein
MDTLPRLIARLLLTLVVCLAALAPGEKARAAAPPVNVTLEPRQISLGETAELTITTTGSGMDGLTLPTVPGLEFRVAGRSQRLEIINGATFSTTSVILRITPQTAGIFTIPGLTPQSQPLVLRVNPDNGSANGMPYGNPSAGRPPVNLGSTSPSGIHMSADGAAFVRMNLPKRDVYVGESIPVDIEVGLKEGFVSSLNGLPTLTGNDFTLNNLSRKPERAEKMIDGKPYTVLTWHSALAPVKPGKFTLTVETPLTIRVRTRPARDSIIDDMLGDPFLQNVFGATVPKDITASSAPAELNVLALPTEGRPADFSGAVGSFKIASDIAAPAAAVGDPVTLRLHVSGTGNFDRVDTSMLEHVPNWKTYPPKSTFNPADPIGYKGEKIFEQPLIATSPGVQALPELAFSYFDPETRRYETARSRPPAVTISPALADGVPPAPGTGPAAAGNSVANSAANSAADAAGGPGAPSMSALRADHAADGRATASLRPLALRPGFLVLPSLLVLGFACGWLGLSLRHRSQPATRAARTQQLSENGIRLMVQMEAAARAGDSTAFFDAAREALRHSFAARWPDAPDELSADELQARLGGDAAAVQEVFALAVEARYAGGRLTKTDFERCMNIVRHQLTEEPA